MQESRLISRIQDRTRELSRLNQHVVIGPGDDCAVVRTRSGDLLLMTVDHLVEGRHFEKLDLTAGMKDIESSLDLIARKAIARSISDIAAMGGRPSASLATACMPPGFTSALADRLFDAMHGWASHWNAPLVGGDIATTSKEQPGPLVLTTTVIGTPHPSRGPIARSGARAGDSIYVTGRLGGSLASGRHMTFEPRVEEGCWVAGLAGSTAMIDISDGLGRDAGRVGVASDVVLEIDGAALPLHEGCHWRTAAGDGEDYELIFTAGGEVPSVTPNGTLVTRIGVVKPMEASQSPDAAGSLRSRAGCIFVAEGREFDGTEMGWDHGA